jgi:cytochrome c oxidase subunit 2
MKDMTPATFLRLVAAAIGLTIVTSVIMLIPNWNGLAGSAEADNIDTLLDVMIVLSSLVFSVVMVMMIYAIWKYRAKPGDEGDGEPIHGNTRLEVIWTVIPTIIVLFGGVYSTIVLNDIEAEASDAMRVDVTAQQFAWRFDYPDQGKTSTELHAPAGRQLELHLQALDVLHSFWVPEWRIKRDLVPGAELDGDDDIDNIVRVTPTVEGTYSVVCTELCGFGHSTMRAVAVTEDQASFDAWLADQKDVPESGQVGNGVAGGNGAGSLADE